MRKGIITISFDDAYLDTYIHAFPYLDKNGIESTFAVPVNLIGKKCENRPVVNWKQLKEMRKKGHDIASHTLSHKKFNTLLSTSKANARSEIINSKRILQKHLDAPIPSFVYPYISRLPDKYVHRIVKQNYTSSRISKNYPVFNKLPIKNRYAVKGFCVMKTHSIGFIKKQVDYVKSNNV